MSTQPRGNAGKIVFCEEHVSPFTTNAVAIGTTTAAVTAWSALVTAARSAYNTQQAALAAAKDATVNVDLAVDAMMTATSSIIKQVRAKADLSGNGVYSLASLPVPAKPSPKGAPGQPTNLKVSLAVTGELTLKWKCPNPTGTSGTIYQVWRKIGVNGELTYLGGTGMREFVDDSLPAGSTNVMYQIQGVRSTVIGPCNQFNVNFGVSATGAVSATVSEVSPVRVAA